MPICDFSYCRAYMDGNCHAIDSRRESCEYKLLSVRNNPVDAIEADGTYRYDRCPKCGSEVYYMQNFCKKCGQRIQHYDYK